MTEPPPQKLWSAWFRNPSFGGLWLVVPPLVAGALLSSSLQHRELNERYFIHSTYYVLFALLAVYAGVRLSGEMPSPRAWVKDNWAGIAVSALVSVVVVWAVAPAFRVLADEANLVGVSKNLFLSDSCIFNSMRAFLRLDSVSFTFSTVKTVS